MKTTIEMESRRWRYGESGMKSSRGIEWSNRANGLGQADAGMTPTPHALHLELAGDADTRRANYRALFRPQLDEEAAGDIHEALRLGMPLGDGHFADTICARLGMRRNSDRRGRVPREAGKARTTTMEQRDFGF